MNKHIFTDNENLDLFGESNSARKNNISIVIFNPDNYNIVLLHFNKFSDSIKFFLLQSP